MGTSGIEKEALVTDLTTVSLQPVRSTDFRTADGPEGMRKQPFRTFVEKI